jgi:hypothetical protein
MSEIPMTCPSCGKERHCYVNTVKRVYYCFKCGAAGKTTRGMLPQNGGEAFFPLEAVTQATLEEPPTSYEVVTGDFSEKYITQRLESPIEIWSGLLPPIRTTVKGLLFMFPGVPYWQERRWNGPPRWVNPHQAPLSKKDGLLYELHPHEGPSETGFLVEGIFDALKVKVARPDVSVACCLGWPPSAAQIERLAPRHEKLIVVPDKDVDRMAQYSWMLNLTEEYLGIRVCPQQAYPDLAEVPLKELRYWLDENIWAAGE